MISPAAGCALKLVGFRTGVDVKALSGQAFHNVGLGCGQQSALQRQHPLADAQSLKTSLSLTAHRFLAASKTWAAFLCCLRAAA